MAKGSLPSQYLYDLGGLSTLWGYEFKQFTGDRMVLFNVEYWIDAEAYWHRGAMLMDDLSMGIFVGVGSAWFAADAQNPYDRSKLSGQPTEPD